MHKEVTTWADKERAAGRKADKPATYVGKVMEYSDAHLKNLETADPDLQQFKAEHKQFQDLFLSGNAVIDSYLAWVRTDDKPKPKSVTPPKPLPKKI